MRIALGVVTCNRPEFAEKCIKAIVRHEPPIDALYVHDDGSDARHHGAYARAFRPLDRYKPTAWLHHDEMNRGVAVAKNLLLRRMLDDEADWLFLIEDDIRITSPEVIDGYIDAAVDHNLHHLSFAHHGPANQAVPGVTDGSVTYYPHAIGAFSLYSAISLQTVGLFDEGFRNAWEHVEHSTRLALAGFTTGPYRWADATDSRHWLAEMPNSFGHSAIRNDPTWQHNMTSGLAHWRDSRPDSFDAMFGPDAPMHDYAQGVLNV